ncbi:DNA repair protein (mre11) [Cyphellophora europaea CBS 101466]|uniref:Double-strand break repair protein n=1 Tax=Cyphellophora europaea (strain CBS 101466) TaxID=1220924 RepID=W2RZ75_CYPE1|nr:DNA repair protein (mre11) [Cyphellophora europaea CBS 101466]ETN41801.1 DNA repair protein (mre11) [Cyphellophora europaea CBS 101466]
MSDTIRILVATDNHVGAHERDPHRSDDSWKTFHEIMELARDREVDMVLLAGDLFHENKPSRKSMYNVMRSLRLNCLGARPCELEILSDGSEQFDATFDYVNYEDPDINVSIPVFSIHGNHDDPSGDGHYAALDLLAMSGLVNYFGRTPESDSIHVRPILLQKGNTKLALYGISNVRDERLYRTFNRKDAPGVTFYQPGTQQSDWFHMICVHQNHTAHSETNYLPENLLPQFLDLVIWGHEHECLIQPTLNPEMGFHVIQPGSSVATSLIPGEAVAKHVTILSVTGREFKNEPIRLRTVRPFVYRDIVLAQDNVAKKIAKTSGHRTKLTAHLISIVENMIEEARKDWEEAQKEGGADPTKGKFPLPLIRLRVEYTSPDGLSKFDVENPQRFSNRFQDRVANTNDVIQYHIRKRSAAASAVARAKKDAENDKAIESRVDNLENIQVQKLVKEFLDAQSLTILPTNYFGDAVNNFVDKDERHALEEFVESALEKQVGLLGGQQDDDESEEEGADLMTQIQAIKERLETEFAQGNARPGKNKKRLKARPVDWDTDNDGEWEDNPAALIRDSRSQSVDALDDSDEGGTPAPARGRGRGRGRGAASTRGKVTTARAKKPTARSRKAVIEDEDDDEDEDVPMQDVYDDEESDSQAMFISDKHKKTAQPSNGTARSAKAAAPKSSKAVPAAKATATRKAPARGTTASKTGTGKQATLNFSASQASVLGSGTGRSGGVDVDDIEDESDGFEEVIQPVRRRR